MSNSPLIIDDINGHFVCLSSCPLVKPIINLSWNNDKVESTRTLTVIENTFETIHCVISANPSAIGNIEWLKNDQLIRGKRIHVKHVHTRRTSALMLDTLN
jgi:hypothetical protein